MGGVRRNAQGSKPPGGVRRELLTGGSVAGKRPGRLIAIEFAPGRSKRARLRIAIEGRCYNLDPGAALAFADALRLAALSARANRNLFQALDFHASAPPTAEDATDA